LLSLCKTITMAAPYGRTASAPSTGAPMPVSSHLTPPPPPSTTRRAKAGTASQKKKVALASAAAGAGSSPSGFSSVESVHGSGLSSPYDSDDSADAPLPSLRKAAGVRTAALAAAAAKPGERGPPPAYTDAAGTPGGAAGVGEEDLTEMRRQFHLVCEQTRRKAIKDSMEELKSHVPTCENQKLTKAVILAKSIAYLQELKMQYTATSEELTRLRSDLYAVRRTCTCGAAAGEAALAAKAEVAAAVAAPLPENWECIVTPEGRPLYVDKTTKVSQWTPPTVVPVVLPQMPAAPPALAAALGKENGTGVLAPVPSPRASAPAPAAPVAAAVPAPAIEAPRLAAAPVAAARAAATRSPRSPLQIDVQAALVNQNSGMTALAPAEMSPLDSGTMVLNDVLPSLASDLWPERHGHAGLDSVGLYSADGTRTFHITVTSPFDTAMQQDVFDMAMDHAPVHHGHGHGHGHGHSHVKREQDEGYHSREASYNGTECDTYMDAYLTSA